MFLFKIKKIPIFFLFFLFVNEAHASKEIINSLKDGGKIVFIRHSMAPGNGDPENFILNDCSTQRNLSQKGVEQSRKIGNFFVCSYFLNCCFIYIFNVFHFFYLNIFSKDLVSGDVL